MARFILEYKKEKFYFDAEQKTDQHVHSDRSSGTEKHVVLNSWRGRYRGSAVWTIPFSKSSSARPTCEGGRKQQDKLRHLQTEKNDSRAN